MDAASLEPADRLYVKPERPKMSSRLTSSASVSSFRSLRKTKSSSSIFSENWGLTWRKALVSAPRAVPDVVLRFTSPNGPHPIVIKSISRDGHRRIPVYVFIPPKVTSKSRAFSKLNPTVEPIQCPVILDFHGGGFILGSCQEQAPFCAKLSRDLNCIVVSVDYRLGPYDKFPAAYYDAEDILNNILHPGSPGYDHLRRKINHELRKEHRPTVDFDTSRMALSGFSSGGSLALNLTMSIPPQENSEHPELNIPETWRSPFLSSYTHPIPVLLYYPALDTRLLPHERPLPPGMEAPKSFWSSLNLEAELMPSYLPKWLAAHPRASPGLLSTRLSDKIHHPAVKVQMILPEMDTLAASNEMWVQKMIDEGRGGDMEVERVKNMLHGWTQFPDPFLDDESRRRKAEIFEKTVAFVDRIWKGGDVLPTESEEETKKLGDGVVDFEGKPKDLSAAQKKWKFMAKKHTSVDHQQHTAQKVRE